MTLLAVHDASAFAHDTGPGFPERVERLHAIMEMVGRVGVEVVAPSDGGWPVDGADGSRLIETISDVHAPSYLSRLRDACASGARYLDTADCVICPATWKATLAGAACAISAADLVMTGKAQRAFVPMRPPGHHCEHSRPMGFCFANNVAIAAQHLIKSHGLERVAIIDFDVHHGNGTQHLFEARGDVFYISTHQHPTTLYPGTGYEWETGTRGTPGAGMTLNVPLMPNTGDDEARRALHEQILPRLTDFAPQFVLISAGFDADYRDPLGSLEWTPDLFAEFTTSLVDAAHDGRVVSVLEGGYSLDALDESGEAHVRQLFG